MPLRRREPRLAQGRDRPRPWWVDLGRDLFLGAGVGAGTGAFFHDAAFGAACGAVIGLLFFLYFRLRLRSVPYWRVRR